MTSRLESTLLLGLFQLPIAGGGRDETLSAAGLLCRSTLAVRWHTKIRVDVYLSLKERNIY